jgi:hypothetical protein
VARGILDLIGLAGVLVFALPLGILGVQFVIDGRGLGWVLLVAAVLMVLFEERVTTPRDLPGAAAERAADRVLSPDEEGAGASSDSEPGSAE